ncbi:hypothetical protein PISMIDRAFT_39926, partial [Pisolithus microcarpus 441]
MPTHGELLSDGLRQLELEQSQAPSSPNHVDHPSLHGDGGTHATESDPARDTHSQHPSPSASPTRPPWPHVHEGYGFRTPSGTSTPQTLASQAGDRTSPLPDPNGLGWPGR